MSRGLKIANRSEIGKIRKTNEDRAVVQFLSDGCSLALVADGMGGHRAGDVASQMASDIIREELQAIDPGMSPEEFERLLRGAIAAANRKVFEYSITRSQYAGMGTTVVVAIATPRRVTIGHIGDSRAYLIRGGTISRLTEDHSLVNELLRAGELTPEEAMAHPSRNVLTRALGTAPEVEVDIRHVEWEPNDVLLLCSDGLSGLVDERVMLEIVSRSGDPEAKVGALVEKAMEAGGEDNITVVLLANEPESSEGKGGRR